MAQTETNPNPGGGERFKLDIVFSFVWTNDGNVKVQITVPKMYVIKGITPDISYSLEKQAKKLLKLENAIALVERDFSTEVIVKEMYMTIARMLLAVLEY